MSIIQKLSALEILDSRGRPTLKTWCELQSGAMGSASVPSGASTGLAEAHELRDGDAARYRGLGCRKAVQNVNHEIHSALVGKTLDQVELDRLMVELDGTPQKSRLGANAMLSVSIAFARAVASERKIPLLDFFASLTGNIQRTLPRPTINLFSGGKHAGGQVPFQDLLIVPASARTMDEAMAMTFAVYRSASEGCAGKYGVRELRADEGGLAPPFANVEAMFEDAIWAIERAGYVPGKDVALAVDVASSHFYLGKHYHLAEQTLDSLQMIEYLTDWLERYPVLSLEDGLAEEDWDHWPRLRERIGDKALVLGDDFLCTNPFRIAKAIETKSANALLLKVNQIGTLSEAAQAARLAKAAGWNLTISARSGETEDDWLADLAVGWGGDQIKVGSITQSERLAKYNRLLEIEAQTKIPLVPWPNPGQVVCSVDS